MKQKLLLMAIALVINTIALANVDLKVTVSGTSYPKKGGSYNYKATVEGSGDSTDDEYDWSDNVTPDGANSPEANFNPDGIGTTDIKCKVTRNGKSDTGIKTVKVKVRQPFISRSGKGVIWQNYSSPKSKGDDADKGAAPSFYPTYGVNNLSMQPGIRQSLFSVPNLFGGIDISPVLSFQNPTVTKTVADGNTSYSISTPRSQFGNSWSGNMNPCIVSAQSSYSAGLFRYYTHSASLGDSPIGGASFKTPESLNSTYVPPTNTWTALPQTKAVYDTQNIEFWSSGITVANAGISFTDVDEESESETKYTWSNSIKDRNGNEIEYDYGNTAAIRVLDGSSISATKTNDYWSYIMTGGTILDKNSGFYVEVSGSVNQTQVKLWKETETDPVLLKTALLSYQTIEFMPNRSLVLLNKVTMPDAIEIEYNYGVLTNTYHSEVFYIPYIKSIETPVDTITFEYGAWGWYGPADCQKYEPASMKIKSNVNNNVADNVEEFSRSGAFNYDTLTAQMTTKTVAGTENEKTYSLYFDQIQFMWRGIETGNTLEGLKQNNYTIDESSYVPAAGRYLYTGATSYPTGASGEELISTYEYGVKDRVVKVTDSLENDTEYVYGSFESELEQITYPNGVVTKNTYDSKGNLVEKIEDYGTGTENINKKTTYSYNIYGQRMSVTDALQRASYNFYNTTGVPASPTSYSSVLPVATDVGWLVARRDPEGKVTTYKYDSLGRCIEVNSPSSDALNPRYIVTSTYDNMGRPITTHYPDATYISNVYNSAGYPIKVYDRAGYCTENDYDAAGHLVKVTLPNGDTIRKRYTGDLVTQMIDGNYKRTYYYYDHEQLVGVKFPDGTTKAAGFDNLNRPIWGVDEKGVAIHNVYDEISRLIEAEYFEFDSSEVSDLLVTTEIPEDFETLLPVYDSTKIEGPLGQEMKNTYDTVGNLILAESWSTTNYYEYDNLGRMKEHRVNNNLSLPSTLEYAYEYDIIGNPTEMDLTIAGNSYNYNYDYDELDRPEKIEFNGLGKYIEAGYKYGKNGKMYQKAIMTDQQNPTLVSRTSYSYDSEQRLVRMASSNSSYRLADLSYTFNDAQQIATMGQRVSSILVDSAFTYDERHQLTKEVSSQFLSFGFDYTYDHARNRTQKDDGSAYGYGKENYEYISGNKLEEKTQFIVPPPADTNQYYYDNAGNLTRKNNNGINSFYRYNAQNKLVSVTDNTYSNYFLYDSSNRRIGIYGKIAGTTNHCWRYYIHAGNVPIGITDSSGNIEKWFVRGVGIAKGTGDVIAEIEPGLTSTNITYYESNHRGDTIYAHGYNSCIIYYDAFGNVKWRSNTWLPTYTFSTKEYLEDAELYLYAYRVYDPIAGRWTQRDPIGYQDSVNLYQFCRNNPVNLIDPTGKKAQYQAPPSSMSNYGTGEAVGNVAGMLMYHFNLCELVKAMHKYGEEQRAEERRILLGKPTYKGPPRWENSEPKDDETQQESVNRETEKVPDGYESSAQYDSEASLNTPPANVVLEKKEKEVAKFPKSNLSDCLPLTKEKVKKIDNDMESEEEQ